MRKNTRKKRIPVNFDPFETVVEPFDIFRGVDLTKIGVTKSTVTPSDINSAVPSVVNDAPSDINTVGRSDMADVAPSDIIIDGPSDINTVKRSDMADGTPSDMADGRRSDTIIDAPSDMADGRRSDIHRTRGKIIIIMTLSQYKVFSIMKKLSGKKTSLREISNLTNVTHRTTRDAVRFLKIKGVFSGYSIIRTAKFQGLLTTINHNIEAYLNNNSLLDNQTVVPLDMTDGAPSDAIIGAPSDMVDSTPSDMTDGGDSSSSFKLITTTLEMCEKICLDNYFSADNPLVNFEKRTFAVFINKYRAQGLGDNKIIELIQNIIDKVLYLLQTKKDVRNIDSFLYSRLAAGFVNSDKNFVTRNEYIERELIRQKEIELANIKKIREKSRQLDLDIYQEKLSPEQMEKIKEEAEKRYKPGTVGSKEINIKFLKEEIIQEMFENEG